MTGVTSSAVRVRSGRADARRAGRRRSLDGASPGEPVGPADAVAGLVTPRPPMPRWGWFAVLAVTAIGGLLRFWRLDRPHELVFDETYYVKQGVSMLRAGYELKWAGEGKVVDPKFAAGDVDVFTNQPDFVVHPPFGKWMIAFGEWVFGPASSWGWRFSAALVGTLSILMVSLIARRLFRSTLLGVIAGVLLAVDGLHYVMSRTGLLDTFVMFWALAAFGCFVIDRDDGRGRLRDRLRDRITPSGPLGPGLGLRWWRLAGAVCLGLCTGTKWSGLFFAAVFGLMIVLWDAGARRRAGVPRWFAGALLRDGVSGALLVVPTVLAVYLATWTGWFLADDSYNRTWGATHPSAGHGWVPDALRSLWNYHQQMYDFNVGLSSPHPFSANPWSWAVAGRPTAFYYDWPKLGEKGCRVAECGRIINPIGNPVVWWGGTLAIAVLLFGWALARDWRAGAVLAGLAGGYLPWFHYQARTVFDFYAVAFTPFMVLGLTYTLGLVIGPAGAQGRRRRVGLVVAGAVVLAAVLVFWFFVPVYTAQTIPKSSWADRLWLPSWS